MRCFEGLKKSQFLANVSAELSLARRAVWSMEQAHSTPALFFDKRKRKELYEDITYYYYFIEDLIESILSNDSPKTIFYRHIDDYVFLFSSDKKQLQEATQYSFNLNGDIPLYKSRHLVNGKAVYTALIDTRLQFLPVSLN